MYKSYLPETLSENWVIGEIDDIHDYLEFIGFDEEFLVSLMKHEYDNPSKPYFLSLSQTKGILERYEFEKLNWPEWFESPEEAIFSALKLMDWIDLKYESFLPVVLEVLVSLGSQDQLGKLEKYFEGELLTSNYLGQHLVFSKVSLHQNAFSYEESAIQMICSYAESLKIPIEEIAGGLLTNERFELIEDLRPKILHHLNNVHQC
jgi:hypothetical protein